MRSLHLARIDDIKDIFSTCRVDDKFLLLHYIQFRYIHQSFLIDPEMDEIDGSVLFVLDLGSA